MKKELRQLSQGFTLIEAMVVVLIMGVILAIGVPTFRDLVEKTRARSAMQATVEAFRVARLTAVQNRKIVKVCPWNASDTCTGADWDKGIMVVNDKGEVIYRMQYNEKLHVTKNNSSGDDIVKINPSGASPGEMASMFFWAEQGNLRNAYCMTISMTGKATQRKVKSATECE